MTTRKRVRLDTTTPVACGSGGGARFRTIDFAELGITTCGVEVYCCIVGTETVISPGTMYTYEGTVVVGVVGGVPTIYGSNINASGPMYLDPLPTPPTLFFQVAAGKLEAWVDCGTSGKTLLTSGWFLISTGEMP